MRARNIVLTAAALAVAALSAGCVSAAKVNQTPVSPGASTGAANAAASSHKAKLGDSIAINGLNKGDQIHVTLVKVIDPAVPTDGFSTPDPGKRFVGIQIRILNTGTGVYDDDPDVDVKVTDAAGQNYDPELATTVAGGQPFDSGLKLVSGGTALGIEVFAMPVGVKPAAVQYGINAGFGDAAQWTLG